MRTAFIEELTAQARLNPAIFLVVGDLGYSVIEPFAAEFPDRFLNAGVAEQNMAGLAAGLASEGFHVFTYSIANFPTLRCLEQIRNDICYHNLPVTSVAVGAGLAYGNLGYSHHAVQDIAIFRTLPNLRLLSPADPGEARGAVQWLSANPCPSYLRLGKAGEKHLSPPTRSSSSRATPTSPSSPPAQSSPSLSKPLPSKPPPAAPPPPSSPCPGSTPPAPPPPPPSGPSSTSSVSKNTSAKAGSAKC